MVLFTKHLKDLINGENVLCTGITELADQKPGDDGRHDCIFWGVDEVLPENKPIQERQSQEYWKKIES